MTATTFLLIIVLVCFALMVAVWLESERDLARAKRDAGRLRQINRILWQCVNEDEEALVLALMLDTDTGKARGPE